MHNSSFTIRIGFPTAIFQFAILMFAILLLAGCAHYPLGMPEEEWHRLTPQQQLDARKEQAALDLERYRVRETARIEEAVINADKARLRHEQDIAEGMVSHFGPVCFGGSRCPNGKSKGHVYTLGGFVFVDKIELTAHDDIGSHHEATISIAVDNRMIRRTLNIDNRGRTHTIFIGAVARNIVLKVRKNDEVVVEELKVFGERLNGDNARILIQQQVVAPSS